jgi:hypothetical protein
MLTKIKYRIRGHKEIIEETIMPPVKSAYLFTSAIQSIMDYLSKKYGWEAEDIEEFNMEFVQVK